MKYAAIVTAAVMIRMPSGQFFFLALAIMAFDSGLPQHLLTKMLGKQGKRKVVRK